MGALVEAADTDLSRIRQEFLDAPTLALTVPQVMRLFDLSHGPAVDLLRQLELDGFLVRGPGPVFRRAEPPMA